MAFDNTEDYLDTRDMDAAIKELEDAVADEYHSEYDEHQLSVLQKLRGELIGLYELTRFNDGLHLTRDTYFEEYAKELTNDIGAISDNSWIEPFIDWAGAVESLKTDYIEVDFDGVTYWVRA